MKYFYKLYEWTDGAKGTDWSPHLMFPLFIEDKLDETLDTGQVTLDAVPLSQKTPFAPKSKFKLERYLVDTHTGQAQAEPQTYWDYIVEKDEVEEHDTFCTHRVHFIEASVVAQGMHCDNIALTYELQDVSLNYRTVQSNTDTLGDLNGVIVTPGGYASPVQANPPMPWPHAIIFFRNSYLYEWRQFQSLNSLFFEQDARDPHTISFTIPTLMIRAANGGVWEDMYEARTRTTITRRHYRGSTLLGTATIFDRTCGPTSIPNGITNNRFQTRTGEFIDPIPPFNPVIAFATGIQGFGSRVEGLIQSPNSLQQFSQNFSRSFEELTREVENGHLRDVSITTDTLSDAQLESGERYEYQINCVAVQTNLPINYWCHCEIWESTGPTALNNGTSGRHNSLGLPNGVWARQSGASISVSASFRVIDMATDAIGADFLVRPRKYNCYDMVRKALLTTDTQLINNAQVGLEDIQYPIIIDDMWAARLKGQTMFETIFEQKNLWEVLLQVGQYLHAIPYLEFTQDGTDRFVLRFRQLGLTEVRGDTTTKITVFNSKNLSEFFTQYDSYVTNLFSPQNIIDEWIVPKTSDPTFLVSNNTAEIHVRFPILEIVSFEIILGNQTRDATEFIFEKSIYNILTPNRAVRPSKAFALGYSLGDNKITGLNYTPPTVNNDGLFALKNIVAALFGGDRANLLFNTLRFRVRYRTKATNRVSMVRPDLRLFVKNSNLENYPRHNQFFGQQDKIVDSERFTANMWGRLIRVANNIYQLQEYAEWDNEKNSGDLILIDGDPYYVMATENELYPEAILQKVTYSKNFNQIANIVTIPSEPRFYEVSERSQVRREVLLMEFLMLSATPPTSTVNAKFLNTTTWRALVRHLIFADGTVAIPNFAYTRFRADHRRQHTGSFGQLLPVSELFPSVEVQVNPGSNAVIPRPSSDHRDVIVPLMRFPLKNAISFVWGMEDNFKAGDAIDATTFGTNGNDSVNDAYVSQQPVRYCDIMGRADLVEFRLFNRTTAWTMAQTQRLPFAEANRDFIPTAAASQILTPTNMSVGLDKDNREAIGFNYQINLLTQNNDFVTFPNLFGEKNSRLIMCLLNAEVSMFDENVNLSRATVVADNVTYQLINATLNRIELRITTPANLDLSTVRAIVIYEQDEHSRFACIARNVASLPNNQKLQSWWLQPTFN